MFLCFNSIAIHIYIYIHTMLHCFRSSVATVNPRNFILLKSYQQPIHVISCHINALNLSPKLLCNRFSPKALHYLSNRFQIKMEYCARVVKFSPHWYIFTTKLWVRQSYVSLLKLVSQLVCSCSLVLNKSFVYILTP